MIGITRSVDSLGRVTIPSDLRQPANIGPGTQVEVILLEDSTILIRPHMAICSICNGEISPKNLGTIIHDKKICGSCRSQIIGG